jgi:hypothetical protein
MCCQVSSCSCFYICSKSLQECKLILREYLTKLELAGLVSSVDGYQSIVSAIAKDICSKRRHGELQRKVKCCVSITLVEMDARKSISACNDIRDCHILRTSKSSTSNVRSYITLQSVGDVWW